MSSSSRKIWIGNIDVKATEYQLLKLVEPFGAIEHFDFVYSLNAQGQRVPRGFAFVTFEQAISAVKAIRQLDSLKVLSRHLRVKPATSNADPALKDLKRPRPGPSCTASSSASLSLGEKQAKIRAMEAKLKALQTNDLEFKVVTPTTHKSSKSS
ncbi:hypothetical protein TCAL_06129 [Tigriopus californicus]|uniref:RRM domain-containing protein n=1 Tax=Tigriopus californicus TaxID=6832 RepID=A0A553NYL8_TIGCA|nr:probable RNA-binding protein 18 isoform X1 [Tigriopus californicus]TRY70533.1 hypothetical protein TCAL_06129 [Tigriopus californicus]|eukprot:TCALIF_06129-PA protein Name:"Similar to rbm18 Probable RNA-binding protein 18 (Danio rerio)" AED:0.13 eAED:0.18 QI:0/-1/0/1/-1/1/1/0/153